MGWKKPFRARIVLYNYTLCGRQRTTGLPLFGEGRRMGGQTVSAGLSVPSDPVLAGNYPAKRRSGNADLCQLMWSTKHVWLQNSSSSPNTTTPGIRNGPAELHTKPSISAASGGEDFSHFFFNGASQMRHNSS